MNFLRLSSALFLAGIVGPASCPACSQSATIRHEDPDRARTLRKDALPRATDGRHLTAVLVSVHYGPGEFSLAHTHPCPVIVYVLEGSIRSKVGAQPEAIYKAGDSFYELPGDLHSISANADRNAAARFLAFFVCDHEAPLSSDAPGDKSGEKP